MPFQRQGQATNAFSPVDSIDVCAGCPFDKVKDCSVDAGRHSRALSPVR